MVNCGRRNLTLNLKQILNVFISSDPNPLVCCIFSLTLYCPSLAISAMGIPNLETGEFYFEVLKIAEHSAQNRRKKYSFEYIVNFYYSRAKYSNIKLTH